MNPSLFRTIINGYQALSYFRWLRSFLPSWMPNPVNIAGIIELFIFTFYFALVFVITVIGLAVWTLLANTKSQVMKYVNLIATRPPNNSATEKDKEKKK